MNLSTIAIYCVHKDKVTYIPKKKGFNYHIEYYLELSKKDEQIKEVIGMFDVKTLMDNPVETQNTINKELVSHKNTCLILSMVPQIPTPTSLFIAFMPEKINDFQKEELTKFFSLPYEFFEFGIYHTSSEEFESILNPEDYNKANFYIIKQYLDKRVEKKGEKNDLCF